MSFSSRIAESLYRVGLVYGSTQSPDGSGCCAVQPLVLDNDAPFMEYYANTVILTSGDFYLREHGQNILTGASQNGSCSDSSLGGSPGAGRLACNWGNACRMALIQIELPTAP